MESYDLEIVEYAFPEAINKRSYRLWLHQNHTLGLFITHGQDTALLFLVHSANAVFASSYESVELSKLGGDIF